MVPGIEEKSQTLVEAGVLNPHPAPGRARDVGDETARNYRYQHSYGVILLASACRGERPYVAIWCEHHEDILAERVDGRFDAWQVKTRRPELGAWTNNNSDFVNVISRFAQLYTIMGKNIDRFHFVSNTEFLGSGGSDDMGRLARSPLALLDQVRTNASLSAIPSTFHGVVSRLADQCGCSTDTLIETLRRVHLVVGPSRGEMDAALSNEHLARVEAHAGRSAAELDELRDDLVALVARASSLHVTSPERHLRAVTDCDARDPALDAKRIAIEELTRARPRTAAHGIEQGISGLHDKIDNLVQRIAASGVGGGLNRDQVVALLQAFSEMDVDGPDAMALLLRKAEELRSLQEALAARVTPDTGANADLSLVLEAFKVGDYDRADTELERIVSAQAPDHNAALAETTRIYHLRASLATARLRYETASEHFGTAAAIAGVFSKLLAFDLLGMQAQALIDDAVLNGGSTGFERAISILARRVEMAPPDSEQRFSATGFLISALGVYSERAPTPVAKHTIEVALGLARSVIRTLDPIRHGDIWLPLANCFGAVLNNAAKLSGGEEGELALAREAVDVLTRAAEIALADDHHELSNIETNLATAHRLVSNKSSDPRHDLKKAVTHRLSALRNEAVMSPDQRGNAYDSLGNDYAALAALGSELDQDAFRRAMAAYSQALRDRVRSVAPINWARTQSNIAANYARACRLSSGDMACRHGRAALARFDLALSVLNPDSAPHDWAHGCFHMAVAVAQMIDADCEPGVARVEEVIGRLADVAEFADRHEDVGLVIQTLDLQAGITRHVFAQRGPEAARLIALARARHQPRLDIYRYTPLRVMFELAEAQFAFMLAYLTGDRPGIERAITAVAACQSGTVGDDQFNLVELAREVAIDMREMLEQMPA
jgi:tetratricopeptide (TPR) repeat protein